jgi:thiamine transporter ThiT
MKYWIIIFFVGVLAGIVSTFINDIIHGLHFLATLQYLLDYSIAITRTTLL